MIGKIALIALAVIGVGILVAVVFFAHLAGVTN